MFVTSDTPDAQYFARLPNINMCRPCDREVSDSRRNWLEHIQGKVHQKRKAKANKQLPPSKRRRSKEGDDDKPDKKAKHRSEPSTHPTSSVH